MNIYSATYSEYSISIFNLGNPAGKQFWIFIISLFILPFILFVNTREVGAYNYMNWSQISELNKFSQVEIGNHSHSHEYLVDENSEIIKNDILRSIRIFEEKLGKNSIFFSYPFGEYSSEFKKIIKDLGFNFAFGQHSGVIDDTKDL